MKKALAALVTFSLIITLVSGFLFFTDSEAKAAVSDDLKLSANYLGLEINQKRTLIAYYNSSDSDYKLEWSSSDEDIAEVSAEGVVTAISQGTATITVSVPETELKAECTVNVLSGHINGDFDFSESNMITNESFEDPYGTSFSVDDGGNTSMAIAYLTRWDGAILEENDKFPLSRNSSDLVYQEIEADYHLKNAIFLPDRNNYLDNNRIKEAIIKYGAVYASFAVNNNCFDYDSTTYYRPAYLTPSDGGHAIAIVGWDDNFSKYNFEYTPEGDGAFICKNSWGTSKGDNGYLYISYYDPSIGNRDIMTVYTDIVTNSEYNNIYQYDPYGFISTLYGNNENTIYAANVFPENNSKLSSDEELKAVSFYTYSENTEYEVFAVPDYTSPSSFEKNKISLAKGTLYEAGYYTIDFDPVKLSAGTRFAVIVRLTVNDGFSRFYTEAPIKNYSEKARANSGESYFAFEGTDWTDLTDEYENCNFCIKAFTSSDESNGKLALSAFSTDASVNESDKIYTVDEIAAKNPLDTNPEFVEYINGLDNGLSKYSTDGIKNSAIPSPIVISSSSKSNSYFTLPSVFNLKDENSLTSVKNQGKINGCWAFATYASLESCLLRNTSNLTEIPDNMTTRDEIDAIISASDVKLESITLNFTEKEVLVAEEFSLNAKAYPINAKLKDVKWNSSDPTIATVNSHGKVSARKPGQVEIYALNSDESVLAYCLLTVKPRLFCITWNVDNKLSTQLVYEYAELKPNITPEKTGYTFIGWEPELPETMPSENIAFTAKWEVNKYSSQFNASGGFWENGYATKTVKTDYGKKITAPENPSRNGYDFAGWDVEIPSAMPAKNLAFNATWVPRNDTKYTVNTYVMNPDGSYEYSSETKYGTTDQTVALKAPDKQNGFIFNESKSVLSGNIAGDGTLVLSVYTDREKYTLTAVADGSIKTFDYYYGQSVSYLQTPHKNGYYFMGWTPEVPLEMPASNLTVHAVFEKIYSISIKNNYGPKSVNYGDTLVLTADIQELPDDTVIKWYLTGNGFDGKVSSDGYNCYLTANSDGTAQIKAVIEYENGEPYLNPNGEEVSATQSVTSNVGFIQIIISFFKNLFGFDRYVIQNLNKAIGYYGR